MGGRSSVWPVAWRCSIRTKKQPRWKPDFRKSGRRPIWRLPAPVCASLEVSAVGFRTVCAEIEGRRFRDDRNRLEVVSYLAEGAEDIGLPETVRAVLAAHLWDRFHRSYTTTTK